MRISKFLTSDEMAILTKTRAQCKQLNDATGVKEAGKRPYVVINGQIMLRDADGKLSRYREASKVNAATGKNMTKN